MSNHSLPVVDSTRTEFGFCRTQCACRACTQNCRHIPGYLIPADLDRMHRHLAPEQDLRDWATQHLLASPGALVVRDGRALRIPTLVPTRRRDGVCVFLTTDGQCSIHAVSPFGCAFFDSHMPDSECDRRSKRGLGTVLSAWKTGDIYARLWIALAGDGLVAAAPEVARQQLRQSCGEWL
jgi:hypothetical protein